MPNRQRKGFINGWEPSGSAKDRFTSRRKPYCLTSCTSFLARHDVQRSVPRLLMAHRVISLPCGILSLSGNNGHRPSGTQSSSIYEYTLATPMDEAKGKLGASQNPSIR